MPRTQITEIHEVELSSKCSLACSYCPHPVLKRPKEHMTMATFERVLEHVRYYRGRGTQHELSLTGIGEAILNPQFVPMLHMARAAMGAGKIILSTNGVDMTPALAGELAAANVGVYVSLHRPEVAGPAIEVLADARVARAANHAFVDSALDWAGQVDWHVSAPRTMCQYLTKGWAVVRQDGAVNACCMDAHGLFPIATIWDEPGALWTQPIDLCSKCNFRVPESMEAAA